MKAKELLPLAIEWLRYQYPESIIIPEMCVGSWGSANVDVAAITDGEIIGVEIKGDGDSAARLERQGFSYSMAIDRMWLLPSEDLKIKCLNKKPLHWGELSARDGKVEILASRQRKIIDQDVVMVEDRSSERLESLPYWNNASKSQMLSARVLCGLVWAPELRAYFVPMLNSDVITNMGKKPSSDKIRDAVVNELPFKLVQSAVLKCLLSRNWEKHGKLIYRGNT